MALFAAAEVKLAESLARFGVTNPFLPERIELERAALGERFVEYQPFVQFRPEDTVEAMFPNVVPLQRLAEQALESARRRLQERSATETELRVYEDLTLFVLYARHMSSRLVLPMVRHANRPQADILAAYSDYRQDFAYYLELPEQTFPSQLDADVMFAGLFQIERAFFHIFRYIVGGSLPAARLRATIWQSVFTHDMRRYRRGLHQFMRGIPTLIDGPSGTGKELVARAIAFSQFIPFDSKKKEFATDYTNSFHGLNLSALPPTLLESELFGHVKGAFTGASRDKPGYLDESVCGEWDTVFLDEIGDVELPIQVKLLRVLQDRTYQRVGDVTPRQFSGKLIAATNRNLNAAMDNGEFREDFYYRLCADRITTPSLGEQLRDTKEDLHNLVHFLTCQLLPTLPDEWLRLTDEVLRHIHEKLGEDYAWPGNIRELEQCVRSVLVHGSYQPSRQTAGVQPTSTQAFLADVENGNLTRDELLGRYVTLVYLQQGSFRAAAKQLETDWRTVQRLVNSEFADTLRAP